jgi:hypothetical protein
MDVVCIYCVIPRNMHLDVEWVHERYNKLYKIDRLEWYVPKVNLFKKTGRSWYHVINTTHVYILVKFERRLPIQFVRKKRQPAFK